MFTNPYGKDWYDETTSRNNDDSVIDDALLQTYTNQLENDIELYIVCQKCGEHLHDGDIYYPEIGVCEYCMDDYRCVVDIDL